VTITYGKITPDGDVTCAIVDNQTLEVIDHNPLCEGDWEVYMEDTDAFYYGPVDRTSQGLVYRLCVDVTEVGETVSTYTIRLEGSELDGKVFTELHEAERLLTEISNLTEMMEDNGITPHKDYLPDFYDKVIEEDEVSMFFVCLYVVPVSVPREVVEQCHGGGDPDMEKILDECYEKYEDYRDFAWDICTYGHHVQIACESVPEHEINACLGRMKAQAIPVRGMLGLYMDRPVNALGWTGWKLLEDAKAFPGQHTKHEGEQVEAECYECNETKPCLKRRTIYCAADNEGEMFCESCLETWYVCPDCGILIPIEPQSWAGVEWQKIDHDHYCKDCASAIFNGPECPRTVKGGTVLNLDDVRQYQQQLSQVNFDWDIWDGPKSRDDRGQWFWEVGIGGSYDEAHVAKYICEEIERSEPDVEFIFGPFEYAQFGATIGLFRRKCQVE